MIAKFSNGKIVGDSFKLYMKHFLVLFTITFICCLPLLLVNVFCTVQGMPISNPFRYIGILGLMGFIVAPLTTGALTHSVYQSLRNRPVTIGESLSVGFRQFLPLMALSICVALFVAAGMILLIIPGIMLACLLYVATPACVVEKKGVFESMRRSRTLTSGRKWQIFVVIFGINLLMGILSQVLEKTVLFTAQPTSPDGITGYLLKLVAVQYLTQTISTGWNATAAALSYYHLRSVHESVDIEDIANVFD